MRSMLRIAIFGAIAVLAVDTVGSIISANSGFPFIAIRYACFVIFAVVGMAAGRACQRYVDAAAASCIVGLVDATLGMYISWEVGPGRSLGNANAALLATASGIDIVEAILIGLVAYAVSRAINRPVGTSQTRG